MFDFFVETNSFYFLKFAKMMHLRTITPRLLFLLVLCVISNPLVGQDTWQVRPFTPQEKKEIAEKLLRADSITALAKEKRMRVLNVTPAEVEKDQRIERPLASATVINYGTAEAYQVTIEVKTGNVVDVKALKGRPQASDEEREDARNIIKKDEKLASMFSSDEQLEGGFVVDPPEGSPKEGRYLEFHITSPDRKMITSEIVVDLLQSKVVVTRTGKSESSESPK